MFIMLSLFLSGSILQHKVYSTRAPHLKENARITCETNMVGNLNKMRNKTAARVPTTFAPSQKKERQRHLGGRKTKRTRARGG